MRWRKQQRARFAALADEVAVPDPFELDEFCRRIAERRGRPLRLVPLEGTLDAELPCGMWLGLDAVDLVFYEAGAAPILRTQIVLHEIAHMLLDHRTPVGGPGDAEARALARAADEELGLATDRVLSLLARNGYSSAQESEAESLATLILERATRAETNPTSPNSAEVLARLNDAFGHPVRGL